MLRAVSVARRTSCLFKN